MNSLIESMSFKNENYIYTIQHKISNIIIKKSGKNLKKLRLSSYIELIEKVNRIVYTCITIQDQKITEVTTNNIWSLTVDGVGIKINEFDNFLEKVKIQQISMHGFSNMDTNNFTYVFSDKTILDKALSFFVENGYVLFM